MVAEVRHLTFSREDVFEAVTLYCRDARVGLPPGRMVDAKPRAGGGITLQIMGLGANRLSQHEIGADLLGAMLLHFLRRHRIPVPRRAEKSLKCGRSKERPVVMTLRLDEKARARLVA